MLKKFKDFFKKYGLSLLVAAGVGALMFFGLGMGPLLAALGTALSGIFTFGAQEAIIKRINQKNTRKSQVGEEQPEQHGENSSALEEKEKLTSAQDRKAFYGEKNSKNMFHQLTPQQQAFVVDGNHNENKGPQ